MTRSRLAYLDPDFLDGDEARPIRILSEYLAPLAALRRERVHDTVAFFGSARIAEAGPLGHYYAAARELARQVTLWARSLPDAAERLVVCSGGGPGIMEAASRGAREAGGRALGLNIGLPREQRPNPYLSPELNFEFHYFFMRKLWFAHLARAIVVFPGGFGTFDELFELLTLTQTGKLARPVCIVLYGSEFWSEAINLSVLERHGLIAPEDRRLFHVADDVAAALALLQQHIDFGAGAATPAFAKSVDS